MKCPRCVQRIHRAAASCPHCGFTLADADAQYGLEKLRLSALADHAGIIRRGDRPRIEAAMARFTARFPQLFCAIHTGSLGEISHIRQFGFWLLNRATFQDVPAHLSNEACILITIDPETKAAGIVFGYLLDPFLDEEDTFDCLTRAHGHFLEGRYAEGLLRVIAHLDTLLRRRSSAARRNPEQFQRKIHPPAAVGDLVRHIRAGHHPATPEAASPEVKK